MWEVFDNDPPPRVNTRVVAAPPQPAPSPVIPAPPPPPPTPPPPTQPEQRQKHVLGLPHAHQDGTTGIKDLSVQSVAARQQATGELRGAEGADDRQSGAPAGRSGLYKRPTR